MTLRLVPVALTVLFCFSRPMAQEGKVYQKDIQLPNTYKGTYVRTIVQDSKGYLWFGTTSGLFCFNGVDFKTYQSRYGDPNTLSDNDIWSLMEDNKGHIWVGTKSGGISVLDPVVQKFKHYRNNINDSTSLSHNFVNALFQDKSGTIWIGTQGGGLDMFKPESASFDHHKHERGNPNTLTQNHVIDIIEDEDYLWLGLNGRGIDRFDPKTKQFKNFRFELSQNPTINFRNNVTRDMYDDLNGNLWVATYGGFNKLDKKKGTYTHFNTENSLLSSNSINSVSGKEKRLLVTTFAGKFYLFDLVGEKFLSAENTGHDIISSLTDKDGAFWMGLNRGKIRYIFRNDTFPYYPVFEDEGQVISVFKTGNDLYLGSPKNGLSLQNDIHTEIQHGLLDKTITDLGPGPKGTIWIATDGNGVYSYDRNTGEIINLRHDPNDPSSLAHDTVVKIYKDEFGTLWACTLAGLSQWDENSRTFSNRGRGYRFYDALRLGKNELWVANDHGIVVIDPSSNDFYMKTASLEQHQDSIMNNAVKTFFTPDKDSVWIGTKGGLNLYVRSTKKMINVHQITDFPYCDIQDIQQDQHKNYWVVTDRGLFQLDMGKGVFKLFDSSYGIDSGLLDKLFFDVDAGEMYLGGGKGYYRFTPRPLHHDHGPQPLFITKVAVFDRPITDTEALRVLDRKKYLELSYNQDMVSFFFVAPNFVRPSKIKYAYRMEGLSPDWIYTDDRSAIFTNLDPGNYVFKVKVANADGIWNKDPIRIDLRIRPPLWATWWAYSLYSVIAISLLFALFRFLRTRDRLKSSLRLEQLELDKVQEVNTIKAKFFANISHEFRTPLTLIQGYVNDLMEMKNTTEIDLNLKNVNRNTERLKRLVDQLLNLSKLEANALELHENNEDLTAFLNMVGHSFSSLAHAKKIQFGIEIPEQEVWTFFDREKLEIILYNLISNALKFTPSGGSVQIRAKFDIDGADYPFQLSVEDTGPGLDEEQQKQVFDRFYRVKGSYDIEGTGIGLALTKELVDLMGGRIGLLSTPGVGSTFKVDLPFTLNVAIRGLDNLSPHNLVADGTAISEDRPTVKGKPTILVVEDHQEMRNYIFRILGNGYNLLFAVNGAEGLRKSNKEIPDLIISDYMMPKMEGDQLCRSIKASETTSHIPFIIVTAKASEKDKLESLDFGADDYLTKPFNKKELQLKVRNHLKQRERMQQKLLREFAFSHTSEPSLPTKEESFMNRLTGLIVQHMENSDLDMEYLSSEMGLSRVQLYRKVLALTGLPTSLFIRKIRIHKAHELLSNKWGTVAEIAYRVGFNNLSYFAKCFKDVYGNTPSDVLKQK
ncbi:MAG: two-component regulator propeller domain-containing protein [Bacteroidota bacterium]